MGSQFRQQHGHMLSRHWPATAFHFRFVCWRVNCICVLQTPDQSRVCRRVLFSGVNSGKQHCKSQFRGGAGVAGLKWLPLIRHLYSLAEGEGDWEGTGSGALSASMWESEQLPDCDCLVPCALCFACCWAHRIWICALPGDELKRAGGEGCRFRSAILSLWHQSLALYLSVCLVLVITFQIAPIYGLMKALSTFVMV